MSSRFLVAALLGCTAVAGLSGCETAGPPGPSLLALPAQGESYAAFRQHDDYCRATAANTVGQTPGQAGASSEAGSALLGAGLGAAAGALIGAATHSAGAGAAIGAGSGLIIGSAAGERPAYASAHIVQRRYDMVYAQCMTSYGDHVRGPARPYYGGPYPPPLPPPPGYYPPPY